MLNNNAELDNGVYNENEEEEKKKEEQELKEKKEQEDNMLLGLNDPIMNKAPYSAENSTYIIP